MKKLALVTAISTALLTSSVMAEDKEATTLKGFFSDTGVTVTADSYPTDETSHQLLKNQDISGVNKFQHKRELTQTDNQPVVRMNRDTYYSMAVIDVSKGATITMPEIPKGKYMSVQPVTEDHRIQAMKYGSGTFNLTTHTGTHVYVVVRLDSTFTPAEAKVYQDKMSISAKSNNDFSATPVNKASFDKVENALKAKMGAIAKRDGSEALTGMFTDPKDSSQELFTKEKYQVGTAIGWGGAQYVDNVYEISPNYPMDKCHQATFADPENEAFWSITVYDKKGFMFNDVAHVSSNTAAVNKDGSYTVSFGCGDDAINNIKTKNDLSLIHISEPTRPY